MSSFWYLRKPVQFLEEREIKKMLIRFEIWQNCVKKTGQVWRTSDAQPFLISFNESNLSKCQPVTQPPARRWGLLDEESRMVQIAAGLEKLRNVDASLGQTLVEWL